MEEIINQMQEELTNKSSTIGEYKCEKCHDTGRYLYVDENGYEFAKICDCGILKKEIMSRRLSFANIPCGFEDNRLNNFRTSVYKNRESVASIDVMVKAIKYWINNFESMMERGKGLYLFSNAKGSGKTRMAVSLANELIQEMNTPVKFATSMQIIEEIKATWDKESSTTEHRLIDALITTDVLIIDDFGTEQVKGWISDKFYSIINGRYIEKKPTIFTSNISIDNLEYDERITNRIKEMCFVIPFPEESVREQIAKSNKDELIKGISK